MMTPLPPPGASIAITEHTAGAQRAMTSIRRCSAACTAASGSWTAQQAKKAAWIMAAARRARSLLQDACVGEHAEVAEIVVVAEVDFDREGLAPLQLDAHRFGGQPARLRRRLERDAAVDEHAEDRVRARAAAVVDADRRLEHVEP